MKQATVYAREVFRRMPNDDHATDAGWAAGARRARNGASGQRRSCRQMPRWREAFERGDPVPQRPHESEVEAG